MSKNKYIVFLLLPSQDGGAAPVLMMLEDADETDFNISGWR
jgi:hypothetical protein